MRSRLLAFAGFVLLLGVGSLAAQAAPVFGPQSFERTSGPSDVYLETFDSPAAGTFAMYLRNGDEEESRVSSASVSVNGSAIVGPSDLNPQVAGLVRQVTLQAGVNELEVVVDGEPGTFLTLVIVPSGEPPVFVMGRLLLPWGRSDGEAALALALKNGSLRFPRAVRVVFFNPGGEVVGVSERMVLAPRASMAAAAQDLMSAGTWNVGSIEIFYAGPGTARVFGSARQADLVLDSSEVQTLSQAGHRLFRGRPMADSTGFPRRRP